MGDIDVNPELGASKEQCVEFCPTISGLEDGLEAKGGGCADMGYTAVVEKKEVWIGNHTLEVRIMAPASGVEKGEGNPPPAAENVCAMQCGAGTMQVSDGSGEQSCVGIAYVASCEILWYSAKPGGVNPSYKPEHPCQCNDRCEEFDNCCHDYKKNDTSSGDVIDGSSSESSNSSGSDSKNGEALVPKGVCASLGCPQFYEPSWPCQCNALCEQFGNCCEDAHKDECAPAVPALPRCESCPIQPYFCGSGGCATDECCGTPWSPLPKTKQWGGDDLPSKGGSCCLVNTHCDCNEDKTECQCGTCKCDGSLAPAPTPPPTPKPPITKEDTANNTDIVFTGVCVDKGCPTKFEPEWGCQCNSQCADYDNCCPDAGTCFKLNALAGPGRTRRLRGAHR